MPARTAAGNGPRWSAPLQGQSALVPLPPPAPATIASSPLPSVMSLEQQQTH